MKQYDSGQSAVIMFRGGRALVLGAPGCGKTDILSVRVLMAHQQYGIPYSDMLCITFTNRASREMKDRIRQTVGPEALGELFVGNLHRFCIRFLYENELVPIDTGLIDDVDQAEIICEITGYKDLKSWIISPICDCASRDFMLDNDFPEELAYYKHIRFGFDGNNEAFIRKAAKLYGQYKSAHRLIDYDDLLLLTYMALTGPNARSLKHSSYPWIQVDEVQDLNPLQFAIIDLLTSDSPDSVVYLGDERQAIYSFLGARRKSLTDLRTGKGTQVFMLSNNYRSPIYLLDMLNDFAKDVLSVDPKYLPHTANDTFLDDGLTLVGCRDYAEQSEVVATLTRSVCLKDQEMKAKIGKDYAGESVGILVRTNDDGERISEMLNSHFIEHVKITRNDMFKSLSFKTVHSHFCVVESDTRLSDWTVLLYRCRIAENRKEAADIVRRMRTLGMTPLDLLDYQNSTRLMEFDRDFTEREIVVFDTETTGLDIFGDDIIQIAAVKVRGGKVVPGSAIDIMIRTDKAIPETLGGKRNPMVAEYAMRRLNPTPNADSLSYRLITDPDGETTPDWENAAGAVTQLFLEPEEAFGLFLTYIGDDPLLGHNVEFDIQILDNNIRRRTTLPAFETEPRRHDTLKIARLMDPKLRSHNLDTLIRTYGLKGSNTHNAIDDVLATLSLAVHFHDRIGPVLSRQRSFLNSSRTMDLRYRLMRNYFPLYDHTRGKLYSRLTGKPNGFMEEFDYVYHKMTEKRYIEPIALYNYMYELFDKAVMTEEDAHFYDQLTRHLYELRTFNEGDLYQNGIVKERISIMTIHKAKGLEFDNVILHNISIGVIPPRTSKYTDESARLLYVGMSRARKRLFITYSDQMSPLLEDHQTVLDHFDQMSQGQKDALLNLERRLVSSLRK